MFLAENKIFSFFACPCIRLILFLLFHKHCLTVLGNDSYIIFNMISNTTHRHTDTHSCLIQILPLMLRCFTHRFLFDVF